MLILSFKVRTVLTEHQEHLSLVRLSGEMERSLELIRESTNLCSGLQQHLNRLQIAVVGSMVECRPPVTVDDVNIGFALEDLIEHLLLLRLGHLREHGLMDWCLRLDGSFGVDFLTTVDEVLQITRIGSFSRIIQVL